MNTWRIKNVFIYLFVCVGFLASSYYVAGASIVPHTSLSADRNHALLESDTTFAYGSPLAGPVVQYRDTTGSGALSETNKKGKSPDASTEFLKNHTAPGWFDTHEVSVPSLVKASDEKNAPEPVSCGVWLLGSGFLGLVGFRRNGKAPKAS